MTEPLTPTWEELHKRDDEIAGLRARLDAAEQERDTLRWTIRNIRLTAEVGRSFGHQATPQTPEKMVERKDFQLDKILGFCEGEVARSVEARMGQIERLRTTWSER